MNANVGGAIMMVTGMTMAVYAIMATPEDIAYSIMAGAWGRGSDVVSNMLLVFSAKLMLAIFAAALFVSGAIFLRPSRPKD